MNIKLAPKTFQQVNITLQYLKCWVVTTSVIAGLQGNYQKDGMQILLVGSFSLLYKAHHTHM